MVRPKTERTKADLEDAVLRRVLQVSLSAGSDYRSGGFVYLEQLAAELLSEGRPTLLSRDILERVLMERLESLHTGCDPPFTYLVGCYRRALEEGRKAQMMKDKVFLAEIQDALQQAKDLAVSYAVLMLGHAKESIFPQPPEPSLAPNAQLLALILADASSNIDFDSNGDSAAKLPVGFFDNLMKRFEDEPECWKSTFDQLLKDLQEGVMKMSPLGPFQRYLRALVMLVSHPNLAKALVEHPMWNPKGSHVNGRVLEVSSYSGAFLPYQRDS